MVRRIVPPPLKRKKRKVQYVRMSDTDMALYFSKLSMVIAILALIIALGS